MQFAGGGFIHVAGEWILPLLAGVVSLAFALRFARANRDGSMASTFALAHFAASFSVIATLTAAAFLHRSAWLAFENLGGGRVMFLSVYADLTRFSRNGVIFYFVALAAALLLHRVSRSGRTEAVAGIPASAAAFATAGCVVLAVFDRELRELPLRLAVPAFAEFRGPSFTDVAGRLFVTMTAAQALGAFFTLSLFFFLLVALKRYRGLESSRFAVVTAGITAVLLFALAAVLQWDVMRLATMLRSGVLPSEW